MSISENIKRLRLEKGLTQGQLANILGVSSQAVSKWETSETYPDGALLVSLANALDASLDTLFDNKSYSMRDVSERIGRIIDDTPSDNEFHIARDICWQIEKSLYNAQLAIVHRLPIGEAYDPEEINKDKSSSFVLNDNGFTCISNGRAPFFSVFPEYGDGFSDVIGDGEEMRKIFAALVSPETMRAVIFIHKNMGNYVLEREVLSASCDIAPEKIDGVLNDLLSLKLVSENDVEIDGEMRKLYYTRPSHKIIALFLFAHELNYSGRYCYKSFYRSKPYL